MKLTVVEGFRLTEIAAWAQQHLNSGTQVLSDGLACFNGVTAAGCVHEPMVTGGGKAAVERPEFRWVNTILGNIKNALCGTYHAVRPKYAQRYLAEFEYRFNRRFDLPDIIPRLVYGGAANPADAGTAAQVTLGLSGNQVELCVARNHRYATVSEAEMKGGTLLFDPLPIARLGVRRDNDEVVMGIDFSSFGYLLEEFVSFGVLRIAIPKSFPEISALNSAPEILRQRISIIDDESEIESVKRLLNPLLREFEINLDEKTGELKKPTGLSRKLFSAIQKTRRESTRMHGAGPQPRDSHRP